MVKLSFYENFLGLAHVNIVKGKVLYPKYKLMMNFFVTIMRDEHIKHEFGKTKQSKFHARLKVGLPFKGVFPFFKKCRSHVLV